MFNKDFPILDSNIVYLDNAATTLKPKSVIKQMDDYYINYPANAHRGDYDISQKVDKKIDETRIKVKEFINAKSKKEIIFTSGATQSLNMIVQGFFKNYLKNEDEILTTKSEHASLLLPLFDVSKKTKSKIKYINLNDDLSFSISNLKKAITNNTKLIAISHVSNVIGDIRPIKEIIKLAHENNILVLVDASQSVPHQKVDVTSLDVDFLVFSAHKMLGPTGLGVLYGKEKYLNVTEPIITGGGMNASFDSMLNVEYKDLPEKLEAGTQNIASIIAFKSAIEYLEKLGMENIHKYEVDLKKYLVDKLSKLNNVKIYNKYSQSGILVFNLDNIFAQDVAIYLNKKNICVRVGNHCAKILSEVLGVKNTIRVSLYFYNTKEDVDKLVLALSSNNILYDSI